jgi:HK97 family phage portal protein
MSLMTFIADYIGLGGAPAAMPAPASAPQPQSIQDSWSTTQIVRGSDAWSELFGDVGILQGPSEQTALTVSAIYASINLIAGAISGLPMHVYKVAANGERDRAPSDPLWWVLNEEFTPRWNAAAGWEFLVKSLLLQGDFFAVIRRNAAAQPIGIQPIHPDRVTVAINYIDDRLIYLIAPEFVGMKELVLDQDDVLHVPGFGFDGIRGMSPLRYALRMTGAVAMATQDFSAAFFANSARPDFALRTEQKLGPDAIQQLRDQLAERHQGVARAFRPMVLQGGLDIKPITMPIDDIQLVAMRQFQIEEIARVYGIPPFMIGHNEKTTSWGSGVEAMGTGFVRYTLRQHLNKIETEFNRKLFRTASRRVEFDTFDLERADMKSMFEAYRVALGRAGEPGWITATEVRERLNMKRKPDGTLNTGAPTNETTPQPAAPQQAQG